jgi:hypothetical protein
VKIHLDVEKLNYKYDSMSLAILLNSVLHFAFDTVAGISNEVRLLDGEQRAVY